MKKGRYPEVSAFLLDSRATLRNVALKKSMLPASSVLKGLNHPWFHRERGITISANGGIYIDPSQSALAHIYQALSRALRRLT
ncbi:hypothetical protein SAMN05660971_01089 [Halomonas cupida]|uniref:Uncharacterized protein n=1 Tax=Halomonas cupida TaxID=44933 RepID=A0A1M7CGW3_9GAMM|nr:hypothetical protein SAMN05660971_01089 [Halomonas cupida]